jgi:predicted secreted protein
VLPPVLLALLFIVLPFLLRGQSSHISEGNGALTCAPLTGLGWYENIPLRSLLSVSVYKRYYALLVMLVLLLPVKPCILSDLHRNGFLIVTFSSAITATIYEVRFWCLLPVDAS